MRFTLEWQDQSGKVEVVRMNDLGIAMFWQRQLLRSGAQYVYIR